MWWSRVEAPSTKGCCFAAGLLPDEELVAWVVVDCYKCSAVVELERFLWGLFNNIV